MQKFIPSVGLMVGLLALASQVSASTITQDALLVGNAAAAWDGRKADTFSNAMVTAYSLEDLSELLSFEAYPKKVGAQVATGDVDGDGVEDIVTLPWRERLSPAIKVFDLNGELIDADIVPKYQGDRLKQYHLAVGDLDGDDQAEIVLSNATGNKLTLDVFAFTAGDLHRTDHYELDQPDSYQRGSWVEVADVDEDGTAEIVTTPMIGETVLDVFSLENDQLVSELTYTVDNGGRPDKGLHIAAKDGAILADEHVEGHLHLLVWTGATFEEGPLDSITGDSTIGDIGDIAWLTSGTYAYSLFNSKKVQYHDYSAAGNDSSEVDTELSTRSKGAFVDFLQVD
jgi:hypothetical protein